MNAVGIVIFGMLAHMALGRWSLSPWLAPDLTALAMVAAILWLPGHPIVPAVLASIVAMALAVHHPVHSGAAYLLAGGLAKWLAHQWDLAPAPQGPLPPLATELGEAERRSPEGGATELAITGLCLTSLTALLLTTVPWTVELMVLASLHIAITMLCLPVARACLNRLRVVQP